MVSSRSRCSARSPIRRWRHGRPPAPDRVPSSAASAPCGPPSFANAIVVLYVISALLGAIIYLYFKVDIRPNLERDRHWQALGLFDLKEHFVAIGLGLLPAYWVCWRRPLVDEPAEHASP